MTFMDLEDPLLPPKVPNFELSALLGLKVQRSPNDGVPSTNESQGDMPDAVNE